VELTMSEHAKDHLPELPQAPGAPAVEAGQDTPQPPVPVDSVGTQLARRRQELGWTIEHVASRLNLAPRQIDALEADNLSALPGLASTRGFVRAYAKLLRLDAAPLVAALTQDAGPQEEAIPLRRPISSTTFAPAKLAPMNRGSGGKRLWGLILLALVVLALAGAWRAGLFELSPEGLTVTGKSPLSATDAADGKTASTAVAAASAPESAPAADAGSPLAPADSAGTQAATASAGSSPAAVSAATAGPAAASPSGVVPAAKQVAPDNALPSAGTDNSADQVKASSNSALLIKVREECWVEIRRGNKSVTRTLQAGAMETVEVGSGVTVVLGNALGVDVSLNGKTLDVRSKARNNVTRLDLKSS
jgi:cytoskeleton protein RodZ